MVTYHLIAIDWEMESHGKLKIREVGIIVVFGDSLPCDGVLLMEFAVGLIRI